MAAYGETMTMKTKQIPSAARIIGGAGLVVFASCGAFAQSAAATKPPAFEVASVKPSPPPTDNRIMRRMGGDPGMVNYSNVTMTMLLANAYDVKEYQVSGPDWFDSLGFDVVAKVPEGVPKEQIPAMLQALLAERFKLTLHRESKTLPVYALIVGRGGPKLKEVDPAALGPSSGRGYDGGPGGGPPPPPPPPGAGPGRGLDSGPGVRMSMSANGRQIEGQMTMAQLANALSNSMDRPVLDLTELKGTYDVDVTWTPDEGEQMQGKLGAAMAMAAGAAPAGGAPAAGGEGRSAEHTPDTAGGSIFSVVQEKLGLKLDPRKNPAEILVIDHAEKVPTEN
jgi:uncharacterized protein (TIGR03435 family)